MGSGCGGTTSEISASPARIALRNRIGRPNVATVLSMPDGVPCTICSHSNASALTCASVSGMLKQSAMGADHRDGQRLGGTSPLARGRSGNTSTRIPCVSIPSRCVISAVTRTGRSESADSRAAAPPPGMISSTPAGCGVTLARIDRPIGAAMASMFLHAHDGMLAEQRMILPKPTFPEPGLAEVGGIGGGWAPRVRSSPPGRPGLVGRFDGLQDAPRLPYLDLPAGDQFFHHLGEHFLP